MAIQNKKHHINLLVTLNEVYLKYLNVMLSSMLHSNPDCAFTVYLLHTLMREEATVKTKEILRDSGELILIEAGDFGLEGAPTTDRFPTEIYYRIFAAKYLPESVDRVLYLDPDIIVNGSITDLYYMPMDQYYFAAASHNGWFMRGFNGVRLKLEKGTPYINSGVLLINLNLLRKEQKYEEVFAFIEKEKLRLFLPDQDIISSLYGKKIYELNTLLYNMTERQYRYHRMFGQKLTFDWIRENSVFIHYCGKNKPWKEGYSGRLNVFYNETIDRMNNKDEVTTVI